MNDISKFNNQYLKCIVTKYDSTVNAVNGYLANSGALIVMGKKLILHIIEIMYI